MTEYDIFEIEKLLLRIDENLIGDVEYVLHLEIFELGSWVVKFRKTGIIVNHCDIIYIDGISIDASLSFKSHSHFWQVVNGGHEFADELSKHAIKHAGNATVIEMFRVSCVKQFDPSMQQLHANNTANVPVRPGRIMSAEGQQPLKAGFLLKKRDILTGWRSRYFIVYPGKLEYYVDQHDIHSRACISLVGAEVHPAKRQTVNGVAEHWGLLVKTKNPDKTFRLASELTGMEGMVEANTWEQVFTIATKPAAADAPSLAAPAPAKSSSAAPAKNSPRRGLLSPGTKASGGDKGVGSEEGKASKSGDGSGSGGAGSPPTLVYLSVIAVLAALTYYVWRFSNIANKALYVTTAVVALVALIGIFVNQVLAPPTRAPTGSSGGGGESSHAAAKAIIAEEIKAKKHL